MVLLNKATSEMTIKVVYYGPGLCGKTTNLQFIHEKANPQRRGKLLSIATETDRTLFFDLLPLDLGMVRGMKVRVQLYTVPGQVFYDATRRLVLRGADGVVFVADSQKAMMDANVESMRNMQENLIKNNMDPKKIPVVLQFNKRDLPDVASVEDLNNALRYRLDMPGYEACALKGDGVHETLKAIVAQVVKNINAGVNHELQPGMKPAVELGPGMKKKAAPAAAPEPPPAPVKAAPPPKAEEEEVMVEAQEMPEDLEPAEEEALEKIGPAAPAAPAAEEEAADLREALQRMAEEHKRLRALLENALRSLNEQGEWLQKLLDRQ
jgi:hypothetical protein